MQRRVVRSNVSSAGSTSSEDRSGNRFMARLDPETDTPMLNVSLSPATSLQTLCHTPATEIAATTPQTPHANTEDVVHDILKRQEDWETERAELDVYLQKVKDMVSTGNATLISNELELALDEQTLMERNKNEDEGMRRKILEGFRKIKELDGVLKEKTLLAQSFDSKPSTSTATLFNEMTNAFTSPSQTKPNTSAATHKENDNDNDDAPSCSGASSLDSEYELRSVHSLDTRTFITEPRLHRKLGAAGMRKHGSAGLRCLGGESSAATTTGGDVNGIVQDLQEKKGYKLGDFIQRNIVLGPQARYYHAMTEVEQDRVEKILAELDEDEDDDEEGRSDARGRERFGHVESADEPDTVSTSNASKRSFLGSAGKSRHIWLDTNELEKLASIDREIMSLCGADDRDIASLVWTPSVWTPSASGYSTPARSASSARDAKSIIEMHDLHEQDSQWTFHSEAQRLKEIDERLRRFHEVYENGEEGIQLESPERIEHLLEQIRAQMEITD
ncbi:hypothetical protein HDU77_002717 [Chytriomyces hyalinus]|nr:hypothetical protein HDU77_002717 [Chytriomyces hyalinus]